MINNDKECKKKIIAVIGGSFNPITKAHIQLGLLAEAELKAAQILYVPANSSFIKSWKDYDQSNIFTDTFRIELIQAAIKSRPKFNLALIDIKSNVALKTYDLLQMLKDKYTANIIYVMGSDSLKEIHTWYNANDLISQNKFFIVPREENNVESIIASNPLLKVYANHFIVSQESKKELAKYQDYSSTKVRDALARNNIGVVKQMVPKETIVLLLKEHN